MNSSPHGLDQAKAELPIFPLPRTVFLPGSVLPLHVFEPRYRAMVDHCRAGWELMGIATLKPGYEEDYEGAPEVFSVVGIGRLVAYQPLPDGRSNILLQYVGRGRIVEELPPEFLFRRVRVDILSDRPPSGPRVYDEVRGLVLAIGRLSGPASEEAERLVRLEGTELLDTLARKLLESVEDQRRYLELDEIESRGRLIVGALGEVLAAAHPSSGEA